MAEFTIRVLEKKDYLIYRKLRLYGLKRDPEAFGSTYALEIARPIAFYRKKFRESWTTEKVFIIGAFVGKALVGMAGFYREEGAKVGHKGQLYGMIVDRKYRGQGIGRAIVAALIDRAGKLKGLEQIKLAVNPKFGAAVGLYKQCGFREYGVERRGMKYKGKYSDLVLMDLELGRGK